MKVVCRDGPGDSALAKEDPALSGDIHRYDHRGDDDYYSQAGTLYRLMNPEQRKLLADNLIAALRSVPRFIQDRQIGHFMKADREYGTHIQAGLAKTAAGDPLRVPVTK